MFGGRRNFIVTVKFMKFDLSSKSLAIKALFSILLLALSFYLVGHYYDVSAVFSNIRRISTFTLCILFTSLIANAFFAVLRFQIISITAGHPVKFRQAMAAVGAGTLGGAIFFQIAGQLIARGLVMKRGGIPFAAVVVITIYEKIVAAFVSAAMAVFGALYIFGKIGLNQDAGGIDLIKIVFGLLAAITCAAWLGFGKIALKNILPMLTRPSIGRFALIVGLTLLVQAPMMVAYIAVALDFSPTLSIFKLIAASAIVMLAASLPISFAGWGLRELSAVFVLGVIGVSPSDALTTAVIIGAGSMVAMAIIMIPAFRAQTPSLASAEVRNLTYFDYERALAWTLPLLAAVFVLFQVYIPIGSGLLNVNLADPIAILAGSLFVVNAIKDRRWPQWRVNHLNLGIAFATLALTISLFVGASRIGWTDWALVNRFAGWFVLLAFGATGALIVSECGNKAFRIFLLTFAGASVGVVLIEVILLSGTALNMRLSPNLINLGQIEGFSQNHNFLAFQLLMAAAAVMILRNNRLKTFILAVLLIGIWFTGSRSGWIAIGFVLGIAVFLRAATIREIAIGLAGAAAVAVLISTVFPLIGGFASTGAELLVSPKVFSTEISESERWSTIVNGWNMFAEHPILGAGLGVFRSQIQFPVDRTPLVIHSTAVWLLAETGTIGFLAFALPGLAVWIAEWRQAVINNKASTVVVLCFVAFFVMSLPADMMYQRTFWLLIGAALALPHTKKACGTRAV